MPAAAGTITTRESAQWRSAEQTEAIGLGEENKSEGRASTKVGGIRQEVEELRAVGRS